MPGEQHYRTVVENFPNGMVALFDHDLRYTVVNGEGLRSIGLDPDLLLGKRLRDVFPPDVYERDEPALLAALAGQKTESLVEFGDEVFRVLTLPVFGPDGAVIQGMVMTQNVTPLRRAEDRLRRVNQTLELAVDAAKLGLWELDIPSGKVTWNKHVYEIYDASPEDFSGDANGWRQRVHPDDLEETNRRFAEVKTHGFVSNVGFRVVHRDGSIRHVYASAALRRDDSGRPISVVGVNWDVTDIRKTREKLESTEARYQRLFENSLDGHLVLDDDGNILDHNRAADQILGSASPLRGRNAWRLLVPNSEEGHQVRLTGDGSVSEEVTIQRPDGSTRHVELRAVAGPPPVHQVTLRDITERRRMEQEHAALDAELRQSQKLEALGRLTGGVAHDLNNLLQALTMQTEEAQLTEGDEQRSALADAHDTIGVARRLVAQLLEFARRDAADAIPLDLTAVAAGCMGSLRGLLDKSINLDFRPSDGPTIVMAEQSGIEQVVMNLCLNARDAMPNGGRLELITRRLIRDDERFVELEVTDSGTGISPEALELIFDPFYTTKELGRGTGLGLAMVYGIMTRHGGTITAESTVGQGTTFRARWPLVDLARSTRVKSDPPRGLVLLADDDKLVRSSIRRYLERAGFEVIAVTNGIEALEALAEHGDRVSLLLLDIRMPRMDGPTAFRRMRHDRPHLPVLFISGYFEAEVEDLLEEKTPVRLLQKPFGRGQLLDAIRDALATASEQASA